MKKHILLLLGAVLLSSSAFAQKMETGFFVGAGSGANVGITGARYENRVDSHLGVGLNVNVYAGYWFHRIFGARIGYQGVNTSSTYTDFGSTRFAYIHADAICRPLPYFMPYLHVGALDMDKWVLAGGAGVSLPMELTDRVSLVPDVRAIFLSPEGFSESRSGLSMVISASLGVHVALGKLKKK